MSVPVNQRTESKLEVFVRAHDLAVYTIKITSNTKNFPEEYRHALTDKITRTAIRIFTKVWAANNVMVRTEDDYRMRRGLQEEAAVLCNVLLPLIEIAWKVFHLESKRVRYWTGKVLDVRKMIRAWREADAGRYGRRAGDAFDHGM